MLAKCGAQKIGKKASTKLETVSVATGVPTACMRV
jgi:hypothetical protein